MFLVVAMWSQMVSGPHGIIVTEVYLLLEISIKLPIIDIQSDLFQDKKFQILEEAFFKCFDRNQIVCKNV